MENRDGQASFPSAEAHQLALSSAAPSDQDVQPKNLTGEITHEEQFFAYGAFSEVYRGVWKDPSTGKEHRIAIKALRGVTDDAELLVKVKRRLLREIRVCMALEHPNITPFLGVVDDLGPLWSMVSPLYTNSNINHYIRDNPEKDRLPLILGVAKGLAYLHSLGVLHGDLKGLNVLVDDDISPRLTDFGQSRIVERRGFTTAFTGTSRYLAPELTIVSDDMLDLPSPNAEGFAESDTNSTISDVVRVTEQSDIYAFAMVVIEILTSEMPWFYLRQEHLVTMFVQDGKRPDRARCVPTHFSDEVWQLMEDCWRQDPQARPQMAATVLRLEEMKSNNLKVAWDDIET